MMYLERPGCNLCMGNQEKAGEGDTVMATSTRLFKGRVVGDSEKKKGESFFGFNPCCCSFGIAWENSINERV